MFEVGNARFINESYVFEAGTSKKRNYKRIRVAPRWIRIERKSQMLEPSQTLNRKQLSSQRNPCKQSLLFSRYFS